MVKILRVPVDRTKEQAMCRPAALRNALILHGLQNYCSGYSNSRTANRSADPPLRQWQHSAGIPAA
jgi:hypothetical protein